MIVDVRSVRKSYGGVVALDGCSIQAKKGMITAIIGPNGSGKSTLFNSICGLERVDSGSIFVGADEVAGKQTHDICRNGVSRTFQDVRLFRHLTVGEHLSIALQKSDEELLKSVFGKNKDKSVNVKEILKQVHLPVPLDTQVQTLSYGQRKLLDIAMAVCRPHGVLLLDEPVAGVNPAIRKIIVGILKNLVKRGDTIVIIEHDIDFVMSIAHWIYVLDKGRVIASGVPEDIQKSEKVLDVYLGGKVKVDG